MLLFTALFFFFPFCFSFSRLDFSSLARRRAAAILQRELSLGNGRAISDTIEDNFDLETLGRPAETHMLQQAQFFTNNLLSLLYLLEPLASISCVLPSPICSPRLCSKTSASEVA